MPSIADELLVESLPEEVKKAFKEVYGFDIGKAVIDYYTYDDLQDEYEDGLIEGRLDAALKEKKDLAKMLERIKAAYNCQFPVVLIQQAISDFENEIVA